MPGRWLRLLFGVVAASCNLEGTGFTSSSASIKPLPHLSGVYVALTKNDTALLPQRSQTAALAGHSAVKHDDRSLMDHAASSRSVGWWWNGAGLSASAPAVHGLLDFCTRNRAIVTTVMMRCGVHTCCRTGTGDCGNAIGRPTGGCTNNHGIGGTIAGELSDGCKAVIPRLAQLGVRPEIWLGQDDSLSSARYLFNHSAQTATALLSVCKDSPDIKGFNLDLETKAAVTAGDVARFASFLGDVTKALLSARGLRFSADVGCVSLDEGSGPLASDCRRLGASGVSKLMEMATYNAGSYAEWFGVAQDSIGTVPPSVLGVGLGCWNNRAPNGSWSMTARSAEERLCYLANRSVREVEMYDLRPGSTLGQLRAGEWGDPEDFWIAPLQRYMKGGGCEATIPAPWVCPNASLVGGPPFAWRHAPATPARQNVSCCESNGNRGASWPTCSVACAKKECQARPGWRWVLQDYLKHPYLCCRE